MIERGIVDDSVTCEFFEWIGGIPYFTLLLWCVAPKTWFSKGFNFEIWEKKEKAKLKKLKKIKNLIKF